MKKLLLFVLAVVLSACTSIANAGQPKSEVQEARDKWQAAHASHYRYTLFIGCFCAFRDEMPLVVEVKDGEVVSLESQTGKELNPANMEFYERYLTIDRIFDGIESGFKIEGNVDTAGDVADEITVTYDEKYGFPSQVNIDFIKNAVDDELSLQITDFEVLP